MLPLGRFVNIQANGTDLVAWAGQGHAGCITAQNSASQLRKTRNSVLWAPGSKDRKTRSP